MRGVRKLTADEVHEIREMYKSGGHSYRQLGAAFNVSYTTIQNIIRMDYYVDADLEAAKKLIKDLADALAKVVFAFGVIDMPITLKQWNVLNERAKHLLHENK
jgi:hypothetical protein